MEADAHAYFELVNDKRYDGTSRIYGPKGLPVEFDLMSGEEMDIEVDLPLVYSTNAGAGDEVRDFLRGSFSIASSRFVELVQQSGVQNLQIFPAEVRSETDGHIWHDYVGINVLGLISCAVLSESTYDEIMPGHYIFDELSIDANKANGALMFRLREHPPTIIIHRSVGRYILDQDPQRQLKGWSVRKINCLW